MFSKQNGQNIVHAGKLALIQYRRVHGTGITIINLHLYYYIVSNKKKRIAPKLEADGKSYGSHPWFCIQQESGYLLSKDCR